ncbi:MAG: hypothetical protein ACREIT_11640, partial [Tepidisphaeraceae bacterium]
MNADAPITEAADPERDVERSDVSDAPFRMFPDVRQGQAGDAARTPGRFQVVVRQSVLNEIYRHGKSVDRVEVCGVLVGNLVRDASGPFLYVQSCIRGDHASGQTAQVTFTAETWRHIQEIMDEEHASQRIVGWYHTH